MKRALLVVVALLVLGELIARWAHTPGYGAPISRPHATLGWELIPGVTTRHVREEFNVEISVNADGFRQGAIPDGPRTVVVLGDSFTFGQGVRERERFTERLTGWRVVNMGVPAYGTGQQVLMYEERRPPADVVVLAYFVDNVARVAAEHRDGRPKPRFELADGELVLHAPPAAVERPPSGRRWLWQHSRLYGELRRRLLPRVERHPEYPEYAGPAWDVTAALIARLEAQAPRLVVMVIPEGFQLDDERGDAWQARLAALDVDVLDLLPALRAAPQDPPLYYPIDAHWTAAGHAVAADALQEHLDNLSW